MAQDSAVFVGIGAAAVCLAVVVSCGSEHEAPVPGFAFVDRGRLVLADPAPEEWGAGDPYFDPEEPGVGRAVDAATIPPRVVPRRGARVTLMDRAGALCEREPGALSLTAIGEDADGHEGSWSAWGYWDYVKPRLVAELDGCEGATWAVVDRDPPLVIASAPAHDALASRTLAALRGTREYRELVGGLVEMATGPLPAEEESVVRAGALVAASIRIPLGWHYEPNADLFALFTVDGERVSDPAPWFVTSLSVFDLEGDGRDEVLAAAGERDRLLLTAPADRWGVTASFSTSTVFHGMP